MRIDSRACARNEFRPLGRAGLWLLLSFGGRFRLASPAPRMVNKVELGSKLAAMPYQSIFRTQLFEGQVGIVTGGGSGIGRCIAHELASLGATVVLASRDRTKLDTVEKEILED